MSRRARLEHEISLLEKKIREASDNVPKGLKEIWEEELVDLSFELNNLVDGDEDNNID